MSDSNIDEDALTAAHIAVENALVEMRDARVSVIGPRNGFVIRERNGDPSSVLRLGTRDGLRLGIAAYLNALGPGRAQAVLAEYMKARETEAATASGGEV